VIKTYNVALGGDPMGPKTQQGDHKTPEGLYVLDSRNTHSQFYKAIHISYPNARDLAAAHQKGVSPGGEVFVHGLSKRLRLGGGGAPGEGLDERLCRGY
jgi:murein L,D-transpeptidase YafK